MGPGDVVMMRTFKGVPLIPCLIVREDSDGFFWVSISSDGSVRSIHRSYLKVLK